jgi:hypothetical protein
MTPVVLLLLIFIRDAIALVDRPFAGFLFLESRIVVSIGRPSWRPSSLRRTEWAHITGVDGKPVVTAQEVQAAVERAGVGGEVTYTLRRAGEVFRLAIPVRRFTWAVFAEVFMPMLAVGRWIIVTGAAFAALRPDLPEMRAHLAVCLALGLSLVSGPDQYGPFRFPWVFYLSLALLPVEILHLTTAFLWRRRAWVGPTLAVAYVAFAVLGILLVARRFEPSIFLPLLYLVYFALANAMLLYVGSLVSVLVNGERPRPQVVLALAAILACAVAAVGVIVTYPLRTEPVSAPWLILPLALWPLLSGLAFARSPAVAIGRGAAA